MRRRLQRLAAGIGCAIAFGAAAQGALAPAVAGAAPSVTDWVNPFIGTDGPGQTFPGAVLPFGMVAASPDTVGRGPAPASGYRYRDSRVRGFSNTHISGGAVPELGDVLLLPAAGRRWKPGVPVNSPDDDTARLDKTSERARPGYYSAVLPDHGVRVELSAQQRVAWQRFTFDRDERSQILVDLQHGLVVSEQPRVSAAEVSIDAARGEVFGSVDARDGVGRRLAFVIRLDRPIAAVQVLPARPGERAPRYVLDVDLGATRMVVARIALSTVDVEGARRNLADARGIGFADVRQRADRAWAELLGRVQIDADERTRRIFYSALYRSLIHPSDIADADGRVRGPRGLPLVQRSGSYYSTLPLFETFRALHPLLTLLVPERVEGVVRTLVEHQRQQGYLPLATLWGRETWNRIGNPALPVLADALAKGFIGEALAGEALEAMVTSSIAERTDAPRWAQREWSKLDGFGYLPFDLEPAESVSKTLELGVGDNAAARFALARGRDDLARAFDARAQGWRQLLDPATRVARGKDAAGRWREPFDPLAPGGPPGQPGDSGELSAWQLTPTVALHDPAGFRDALGGAAGLRAWLDAFTALTPPGGEDLGKADSMVGQLAHGHVSNHHVPWLYAYSDRPWSGHALVRRLATSFYGDGPAGLAGSDSGGQAAAWYVFAALGLYPLAPASGSYVAGAPLVRSATIALANGRMLRIVADGSGEERPRAAELLLNGSPIEPTALTHEALALGGVLRFRMAALP